jgi:hypothetical protein
VKRPGRARLSTLIGIVGLILAAAILWMRASPPDPPPSPSGPRWPADPPRAAPTDDAGPR